MAKKGKLNAEPLNRSLRAANYNTLGLNRLICTNYDVSPLAGQMTPFDEYNAGNGKRKTPTAIAVIVDHVTDKNNDGAADIEDAKVFLKPNHTFRNARNLRRLRAMFRSVDPPPTRRTNDTSF